MLKRTKFFFFNQQFITQGMVPVHAYIRNYYEIKLTILQQNKSKHNIHGRRLLLLYHPNPQRIEFSLTQFQKTIKISTFYLFKNSLSQLSIKFQALCLKKKKILQKLLTILLESCLQDHYLLVMITQELTLTSISS